MTRYLLVLLLMLTSSAIAGKITTDPNAPGAQKPVDSSKKPDPRLAQKITYKVRLKPMTVILDDWSKTTGIKLVCGKSSSDWVVREDVATIHAQDVPLGELMNSLARVMRFAWIRSGTEPDWTYRLVEDPKAIRRVKDLQASRERDCAAKRKRALDLFMSLSSPTKAQLAYLKENNPSLYVLANEGVTKPLIGFLRMVPEVTRAWIANREYTLNARDMSPAVFASYQVAARELARCALPVRHWMDPEQDVRQRLDDLDAGTLESHVLVWRGYSHTPYGGFGLGNAVLPLWQLEGMQLLRDKARLKAAEEKRPFDRVWAEMQPDEKRLQEWEQKHREIPGTERSEDPLRAQDEPYLHEKLKKKIESDSISMMVFQLAQASGLAVVTDDFRGRSRVRADAKRQLGDTMSEIASTWYMNWQRHGGTIELWSRDWYELRQSRVSRAWLDGLRKRFTENGTLDIDDLCDVAALTPNQYGRNIVRDKVLNSLYWTVSSSRKDYLRLYGSLTRDQRAMLFSEGGLGLENLNDSQLESALKLAGRVNVPALEEVDTREAGIRVTAARTRPDKAYAYTLRAFTPAGPIPGEYTFRTPVYVGPEDTANSDR